MKPKPETDRVRIGRLTDTDRYWIGLLSPEQRQTALVAAAKKKHADVLREQEIQQSRLGDRHSDNGDTSSKEE